MKMSSEKEKIFGVILSFLLVFSMSVPVMAEDENLSLIHIFKWIVILTRK